jgi:hypothetical protein
MTPMTALNGPKRPSGLGARGAHFWTTTTTAFTLEPAEQELLAEICRTLDLCDQLRAAVARAGLTWTAPSGQERIHPGVAELRQARALVGRLLGQLALPNEDELPLIASGLSVRGRSAATSRWGGAEGAEARRGTA